MSSTLAEDPSTRARAEEARVQKAWDMAQAQKAKDNAPKVIEGKRKDPTLHFRTNYHLDKHGLRSPYLSRANDGERANDWDSILKICSKRPEDLIGATGILTEKPS